MNLFIRCVEYSLLSLSPPLYSHQTSDSPSPNSCLEYFFLQCFVKASTSCHNEPARRHKKLCRNIVIVNSNEKTITTMTSTRFKFSTYDNENLTTTLDKYFEDTKFLSALSSFLLSLTKLLRHLSRRT